MVKNLSVIEADAPLDVRPWYERRLWVHSCGAIWEIEATDAIVTYAGGRDREAQMTCPNCGKPARIYETGDHAAPFLPEGAIVEAPAEETGGSPGLVQRRPGSATPGGFETS